MVNDLTVDELHIFSTSEIEHSGFAMPEKYFTHCTGSDICDAFWRTQDSMCQFCADGCTCHEKS